MGKLKKYFQERAKDKYEEAYARTMASLISNLKEMELLLKDYNYACEHWIETMKDLEEIEYKTKDIVKRYNKLLETISEPQD
jgi:hypothetical protein